MDKFQKFSPLVKVDEKTRTVWGIVTAEVPDKEGEICDYDSAKKAYTDWSQSYLSNTTAAGQEQSLGNIRIQHGLEIGGKATKIEFKDDLKQVWLGSTPVDDRVWNMLKGGFLTGYSHAGNYSFRKADGDFIRYGVKLTEVSYVDNPCLAEASFAYVKADGSIELRKFATAHKSESTPELEKSGEALYAHVKDDGSIEYRRMDDIAVEIAQPVTETVATEEVTHAESVEKTEAVAADTSAETAANTTQGEPIQRMAEELNLAAEALSKAEKESVQGHLKNAIEAHAAVGEFLKQCMATLGADGDADKAATAEVEKAEEAVAAVVAEPVIETAAEPVAVEAVIEKAAPVVVEPNAEVLAKMNEMASQFSVAQETIAKLTERLAVLESKPVADNVAVSGTLVARTAKAETSIFNNSKDITDTGL